MAKFIIRRLLLMLLTMLIVSIAVFLITEAAPGNVARNVLGVHITPEQEASFLNQQGLDEPFYERYFNWLIGTDWRAERKVGLDIQKITRENDFKEWWAVAEDGTNVRWEMEGEDLVAEYLLEDGTIQEKVENFRWEVKSPSEEVERLTEYRQTVADNDQLDEDNRQLILEQLDQILEILRGNQPQDELLAALEGPESRLESLIDQEALRAKGSLTSTADEITRKNNLVRVLSVHERLDGANPEELEPSDIQAMARVLKNAADDLRDVNPGLADSLEAAGEDLGEEDLASAESRVADAVPTLNYLMGSTGQFLLTMKDDDYRTSLQHLADLTDPALVPLDNTQLTVLTPMLDEIADALGEDVPGLSGPLLLAVEDLQAGNTGTAREHLQTAVDHYRDLTSAIVRSESARGARVARTFWGVNSQNLAVQWEKGTGKIVWRLVMGSGWLATSGGPVEYIPLQKGLLRGDPGLSLRTGRPVADLLFTRLRNSLVLAGIAFAIVMPIALVLGLIAGLNEGKTIDRVLSIGGMMFSVTPEFATGIFLILIFAFWLEWVPGATVFGEQAPWERPEMLILPVLTLTLIELGYVLRITRASMSDVMKAPYIRTAYLKGLPRRRVVFKHAIRNALMSPITVIMLHVNWLLGGIVVVEVIFGYPGLGSYLLDSALFKDFNAIEGGAMILVAVAVGTQLIADIIYTFLNPRIRYD